MTELTKEDLLAIANCLNASIFEDGKMIEESTPSNMSTYGLSLLKERQKKEIDLLNKVFKILRERENG